MNLPLAEKIANNVPHYTMINNICSPGNVTGCRWFEPSRGSQEKRPFSNGLFSIQSEGLACNLTAGEYVIAEGVWHHASACILLRIDYIQHFVLIPYRRQAADFIHGFAVILRVAFLYYELRKKHLRKQVLFSTKFALRASEIASL